MLDNIADLITIVYVGGTYRLRGLADRSLGTFGYRWSISGPAGRGPSSGDQSGGFACCSITGDSKPASRLFRNVGSADF